MLSSPTVQTATLPWKVSQLINIQLHLEISNQASLAVCPEVSDFQMLDVLLYSEICLCFSLESLENVEKIYYITDCTVIITVSQGHCDSTEVKLLSKAS